MSTSIIEPGTRLAGRYRLENRVSDAGGSTLWKAIDEILARAVAVRTFAPDFPHVNDVVTAARAASRLTDPRLTQVFDADDSDELAYVVSEWVNGETLHDMVASRGPLEPGRAATLLYEAAEAIAAAHAAGLAHLRLSPDDLLWTTGGTVKLLGLGVEAALGGVTSDNPALVDAQGLGRMLYAALTAHSADPGESLLPAAPAVDGQISSPRRLQARVPHALDAIVCRTLGIDAGPGHEPLTTPAALAEALAGVPRTPLPLFAGLASSPSPAPRPRTAPRTTVLSTTPQPAPVPSPAPSPARHAPRVAPRPNIRPPAAHTPTPAAYASAHDTRPPVNRPLIAVAAALATVVVGVGGWQITHMGGDKSKTTSSTPSGSAPASKTRTTKVDPVNAIGFDPFSQDGSHDEKTVKARLAYDGSPSTYWETEGYRDADLRVYKKGVGLLLDLGKPVKISDVKVTLPSGPGAVLELRVGDAKSFGRLPVQGQSADATGTVMLRPPSAVEGRYVLLWFTKLASDGGDFRGKISDVIVHGTSNG